MQPQMPYFAYACYSIPPFLNPDDRVSFWSVRWVIEDHAGLRCPPIFTLRGLCQYRSPDHRTAVQVSWSPEEAYVEFFQAHRKKIDAFPCWMEPLQVDLLTMFGATREHGSGTGSFNDGTLDTLLEDEVRVWLGRLVDRAELRSARAPPMPGTPRAG